MRTYVQLLAFIFFAYLHSFGFAQVPNEHASRQTKSSPPVVLAHYMPWYTAKPVSDHWGWHWTMNHFDPEKQIDGKRQVASKYYPMIGPYDSGDVNVIEYHLLTMKLSGIDGVIVDWYGFTDFRDYGVLHRNTTRLLQQCERLGMKFVICYEDQTIPALVDAKRIEIRDRAKHATDEIEWLGKYWFKSGSYLKFDGKPLLLSFGHSGLTVSEWSECLSGLSFPIAYFSQNIRRDGATGGFDWPAPRVGIEQVDRFLASAKEWPAAIPAAFPRFDDIYGQAEVSEGYPVLPDNAGNTFKLTFQKAMNSNCRIIQIATWNDWGEGTQIEPSTEFGYRDLEYLRSILEAEATGSTGATADDLKLPLKLLQLRRTSRSAEQQQSLDAIAKALANGRIADVRQRLELLESK